MRGRTRADNPPHRGTILFDRAHSKKGPGIPRPFNQLLVKIGRRVPEPLFLLKQLANPGGLLPEIAGLVRGTSIVTPETILPTMRLSETDHFNSGFGQSMCRPM
jgi:hypothetical protein